MAEAAAKAPSQGSPFWHFSLGFYRVPGVADACIRLQDEAGVDVNVLFFVLWNASLKRMFSAADMKAIDGRVAPWRETTVIPLRNMRRALKSSKMIEPGVAEVFRTKIKGLELEAERLQQEALYDFAQSVSLGKPAASAEEAARANVAAYEKFSGRVFPQAAVTLVLDAFMRERWRP
jgi:uncharacterized protein (TIGR02444 family)